MKKLKVVTIVGTRPEIIRLSRLIPKLDQYTDHVLVHTGQNSDPMLNDVFFDDLELRKPDYFLDVDTSSMGSVMGDTIKKSEEVLLKEKPDAVMILGDTNSSVAAIVAERMHIPVYHMEAGNRSFDANVPEELNRKMVDHVASFNLPYNEHSRRNLISEGLNPRFIYATGSPLREVIESNLAKIKSSTVLSRLGLKKDEYFLVSAHRQENVDPSERLESIVACLVAVRDEWSLPIIVSTHPRTKKRLEELGLTKIEGVSFHAPLGYLDYNNLQLNSRSVISDSGTLAEEAAILGFSAVSLRDSTERPEALERGTLVLSGLTPDSVLNALRVTKDLGFAESMDDGYAVRDFSDKVIKLLFSTSDKVASWRGVRRFK
jgi:UDP-N-acetylglucosamine 2-epimerase (non-hydrolysing)